MYYRRVLKNSKPSEILNKIKMHTPTKKTLLTKTDILMLHENETIDDETLVRILETCRNNNLNINEILYKTDKYFLIVPRAA